LTTLIFYVPLSQAHDDCKSDVQTNTPFPHKQLLPLTSLLNIIHILAFTSIVTEAFIQILVCDAINFHNNNTQSQTSSH